jgi:ADP-ribose pyrophosphatase YjhB (NUDIX family)
MIKLRKILESMDTESTAGICLFYDSKLLACKRTDSYWSIPKGHLHIGEVPSEGVQRELTEETQIVLNGEPELVYTKDKENGKFYLFKFEMNKKLIPRLDHEHEDWGYFEVTDLPKPFDETVTRYLQND